MIYQETSSGVEFSMLISRMTQEYLIWDLLFQRMTHDYFETLIEFKFKGYQGFVSYYHMDFFGY